MPGFPPRIPRHAARAPGTANLPWLNAAAGQRNDAATTDTGFNQVPYYLSPI